MMKSRSLVNSFNYAADGIIYVLRTQRNMQIHFAVAAIVLIASLFFGLSRIEYIGLFLTITLVIIAEMFNTAIESAIDVTTHAFDPIAMIAKDVAAAAVMLSALNALVVGYLIFFDRLATMSTTTIKYIVTSPIYITIITLILVLMSSIIGKSLAGKGTVFKGGMPSAHSALAFSLWTITTFITYQYATPRLTAFVSSLVFFMALLVLQTRVEAGIHTVSEVIIGALLGALVTVLVFQAYLLAIG